MPPKMDLWFCRLQGTVIVRIWYQILIIIVYTAGIVAIHKYVPHGKMEWKQTLIPILGVVTGLLLVFRTNTAYDRYWEGRRLWSQMTTNIRTLTRGIWTGVKETEAKDVVEKKSVLNILVAFAVATKHYLREEYSYDHEDLRDLIGHLPTFSTPSSNLPLAKQKIRKRGASYKLTAYDSATPTNIPIELSYYIATYLSSVNARGAIETPMLTPLHVALTSLTECLTGFERILRTPIPLAYSVHLQYVVWLYLLALPYQLVNDLNWWTIPAVALASFSLLGILGIGWEIENPFGYDDNDLPLDDFCKVIKREIRMIIGNPVPKPEEWVMSERNFPLLQTSPLNAKELAEKTIEEVHAIMREDARAVILDSRRSITFNNMKKSKGESTVETTEENANMLITTSP